MDILDYLPREVLNVIRTASIAGFIVFAVLLINLNHKAFEKIFKDNSKKYWWLFIVLSVIPFLLILYIFTFIFKKF